MSRTTARAIHATVFAFACTKGGVGKTTLLCNFAAWLAMHGLRVLIIDSDEQGSAAEFVRSRARATPALPAIEIEIIRDTKDHDADEVAQRVAQLGRRFDAIVIDTQGSNTSKTGRSIMEVVDVAVVPTKADMINLRACERMDPLLKAHKLVNPSLQALAILNDVPREKRLESHNVDALGFVRSFDAWSTYEVPLWARRPTYADAWQEGRGVFEFGKRRNAASDDFDALARAIVQLSPVQLVTFRNEVASV